MREATPPRQRQALEAIAAAIDAGSPPTHRELGLALGIRSTNAVADLLAGLERRGLVWRAPFKSRVLRVTAAGYAELGRECCPTCGRPAAG